MFQKYPTERENGRKVAQNDTALRLEAAVKALTLPK
jgi:hypothetical protein